LQYRWNAINLDLTLPTVSTSALSTAASGTAANDQAEAAPSDGKFE